ncbi:Serine/threonine-protein kinase PknL [Streptomyces griseus]
MTTVRHTVTVPKGYRIGAWEVHEPLASGAFTTVYGAHRDQGPPRTAALKVWPTGARTPHRPDRLRGLVEREITLLGRLRSPRLIRMYDTLVVDDPQHPELHGATVLVLERAASCLATAPAPADPGPVLLQICEGLAQLHEAGWVHGDLKPANVLLMPDGSVRLADFNTAAELEGTHAYAPPYTSRDYTPPEQLWPEMDERGTRVRPSVDVWAFGVLAHTILTGAFPFPGSTTAARCDAAARYARTARPLRLPATLPHPWREIIHDCLAYTPADRPDPRTLLHRLR